MKFPTLDQVRDIWEKIRRDPDGRIALDQLAKAGFDIRHLRPNNPTFKRPTWGDYIAAIPFLSNRLTHRRIHRRKTLRKYLPLLDVLRTFADKLGDPFCEIVTYHSKDFSLEQNRHIRKQLIETADFLEHFLSWDWYVRDRNPRNSVIAALRWNIRFKTGKPHDSELARLIDAALRADGQQTSEYLEPAALDRIEKREKIGRVKARHTMIPVSERNDVVGNSTKLSRKRRKRV